MNKITSYARLECEILNEIQIDATVYAEYDKELMLWHITSYRDKCNITDLQTRKNILKKIKTNMIANPMHIFYLKVSIAKYTGSL